MSRRRRAEKREVLPDPKFGDKVISKFMCSLMLSGKKSTSEKIKKTDSMLSSSTSKEVTNPKNQNFVNKTHSIKVKNNIIVDSKFKTFKKDPRYTAILEHVSYEHGREYVESIQQYLSLIHI